MDRYWRLAGNPGFNASIDHIRDRLIAAGFTPAGAMLATFGLTSFRTRAAGGTTGSAPSPSTAAMNRRSSRASAIASSLAINSFPPSLDGRGVSFGAAGSPGAGFRAALVDVGAGAEADYAGKDVKGAVVLGDAPLGRLWQEAVRKRGAAGVVSTAIARYIRPADPQAMSDEQQDVLQWGSVPYDAGAKAFGFKASWRAADRMRRRLKDGPVTRAGRDRLDVLRRPEPHRSSRRFPGRSRPAERIVMVAHVQEPGANDDASGCGTLYGLARALAEADRTGALPRPERTLTFMWVDEIRGSQQWIASHPGDARGVQYMFALDMTGEDTAKTGGTFLIEKQADPSAVWARPSDPHSEWGASQVAAETLQGQPAERSAPGDLPAARRATRSGSCGPIRTKGAAITRAFAAAGVPSLLNWHFTDRYYHTNQDTAGQDERGRDGERRRRGGDVGVVPRVGRRARRGSVRRSD